MKENQVYEFRSSGMCCFVTGWAVSCILKVPGAFVIQAQAVQEEDVTTTVLQSCGNHLPSSIKLYRRRLVSSATLLWESQVFVVQVVAISFDHHLNLACCFWSNECDCSSSDQAVCQFDNYNNYMACHLVEILHCTLCLCIGRVQETYSSVKNVSVALFVSICCLTLVSCSDFNKPES